tara:strand:- start:58668 stop:58784 length:117 start_codon:yes stop_codon:yes gene_type:complete
MQPAFFFARFIGAFCWAFALADGRNALKDNGVIGFMVI